jgi:hypothetical protein
VKVLLISLKAGGVALNLTVASRIFLMGKILNSVWLVLLRCYGLVSSDNGTCKEITSAVNAVNFILQRSVSYGLFPAINRSCSYCLLCALVSIDPWWNPAAEMQAIDRTHRIGQHKPIYATRFIIENTIEERILRLQEKKKLVFDGTVGGDAGSMSKLTVDDMRFLFN